MSQFLVRPVGRSHWPDYPVEAYSAQYAVAEARA
jgi:hypothetical protein